MAISSNEKAVERCFFGLVSVARVGTVGTYRISNIHVWLYLAAEH